MPGIRENGGQYTHAATWVVQAAALQGRGDRAVELFDLLNPIRHATDPESVLDGTGEQVAHPGSGSSVIAGLSDRVRLPDWLTEDGWWRGEVEREREVYVARADRQIGALRDTHAQDDVVGLVSHGWFGNVLLGRLLGIEHMNGAFELANTSISLLEDTEEGVPWEVTAIRINWLPHLAVDQVSDSALGGQLAAGMP